MMSDNRAPNWKARFIAFTAVLLAVAGGLWLFNKPSGATESSIVAATSCSGFAHDARQLFNKGDTAALRGAFAPGDHVHLVIDFTGIGYSWELTGVLAMANKAQIKGAGDFTSITEAMSRDAASSRYTKDTWSVRSFGLDVVHDVPEPKFDYTSNATATSHGKINGFARLEMDIDVTAAGGGALTINKARSVPLPMPPRVVSASCNASKEAPAV